jgi:hypothetical protein
MTTRNFRVKNGLSVGDITISASANTITGLATAAPSADGDVANKKYVDDQDANIASDTLTFTNKTFDANGTGNSITNIEVADFAGTAIINVAETLASNDSDTALVTAGAIIDYVDAQDANIAGDTLTFTNKTFDANGTGNSITNIETCRVWQPRTPHWHQRKPSRPTWTAKYQQQRTPTPRSQLVTPA